MVFVFFLVFVFSASVFWFSGFGSWIFGFGFGLFWSFQFGVFGFLGLWFFLCLFFFSFHLFRRISLLVRSMFNFVSFGCFAFPFRFLGFWFRLAFQFGLDWLGFQVFRYLFGFFRVLGKFRVVCFL